MAKSIFQKTYTRDTTIIIQESWGKACNQYLFEKFGWKNPHSPAVIHYFNHGTIEIWENVKSIKWIINKILNENKKGKQFYEKFAVPFEKKLELLQQTYFKSSQFRTKKELTNFIELVDEIMVGFLVYYYSAITSETPDPIKSRAKECRKHETFFSSSSELIRNSILYLYPGLKGSETALLSKEVTNPPSVEELRKRLNNFIVVDGVVFGSESLESYVKKINASLIQETVTTNSKIVGEVGYRGKVKGKVFLLFRQEQISLVPKGAIIVSPMTTPSLLPALKRAAAIITDEGGSLCHAAIVARELKIPCIVGTKIATKVLKDGDRVEVDAEKGIVQILKDSPKIKSTSQTYLKSIDWVKFLERRRSCFIYHPYIEAERFFLPKITGFVYTHHLYKWAGEQGTHYRSTAELQRSMKHFLHIVESDIPRIKEWKELGIEWDQRAKELVIFFNKNKAKVALQDFQKYYEEFVQILLYTVTIPYLCLSSIDYALAQGESKKKFTKVLTILEPLRAFTTYPQLERSMLAHFWNLLQKKTGIKSDLLDKLTPQEIIDYINGESLPNKPELEQRKEWCIFWYDALLQKVCYEYDSSITITFPFLEETKKSGQTISGTTAFPGKVIGVIRRVDNIKDLQKYKPGEIIVSINTSPDLMSALRTCSAIISDEGGITCHATIVARELKKPCIIGTKNATKVLKDGDMVEVDANKGIVKKVP